MFVCFQTKLVTNCGSLSRVRRFTDTGGVAAPDTESVGFPLGEIKQSKTRRLDWDLRVHPLPAVRARDTLKNKDTDASQIHWLVTILIADTSNKMFVFF